MAKPETLRQKGENVKMVQQSLQALNRQQKKSGRYALKNAAKAESVYKPGAGNKDKAIIRITSGSSVSITN